MSGQTFPIDASDSVIADVARSSPFEFDVTLCPQADSPNLYGVVFDGSVVVELSGEVEVAGEIVESFFERRIRATT